MQTKFEKILTDQIKIVQEGLTYSKNRHEESMLREQRPLDTAQYAQHYLQISVQEQQLSTMQWCLRNYRLYGTVTDYQDYEDGIS